MLRSEAISIIKRGLGFRQTQDAAIISALQQAQRDMEMGKTLPSWLVVFDAAIAAGAGVATATLPTGFIRFHEEYPLWYVNSDGDVTNVPKRNSVEAGEAYGDDDSGYAQVFVQRNPTTIELVPPFTVATTLYLTYYKKAVVLDSDVENAWLLYAPDVIIGMAGATVAANLRDASAVQTFSAQAQRGQRALLGSIVDEELAGRPLIMGRNN